MEVKIATLPPPPDLTHVFQCNQKRGGTWGTTSFLLRQHLGGSFPPPGLQPLVRVGHPGADPQQRPLGRRPVQQDSISASKGGVLYSVPDPGTPKGGCFIWGGWLGRHGAGLGRPVSPAAVWREYCGPGSRSSATPGPWGTFVGFPPARGGLIRSLASPPPPNPTGHNPPHLSKTPPAVGLLEVGADSEHN